MGKFFNQKVKNSGNSVTTIVIGSIVGVLIVIAIGVLISVNSKNSHKDAVIKMRDSVAVEVNSSYPDKTLFFSELENVKESDISVNYDKANLKEIGTYDVVLTIYKKSYQSKLQVVDTESPTLSLKDLTIEVGSSYKASDFVKKCEDNSKKECNVSFYDLSLSQTGEKIDYSKYTEEGTYTVQIIASDESGNSTSPQSAKLIIGKDVGPVNTSCKYGNSSYDTNAYKLAVNVTENGCALDLNVYQDADVVDPVNVIIKSEQSKLNKEFSKINLNTENVYVNSEIGPVLNTDGKGIVGYTLRIVVSIVNANNEKEIIEDYYVNINGGREYIVNKYL